MVMRKLHSAALAGALKERVPAIPPGFRPLRAEEARVFQTQKRMSFVAEFSAGRAYLLIEPAGTARDNYFNLDFAWVRADVPPEDPLMESLSISEYRTIPESNLDAVRAARGYRFRVCCIPGVELPGRESAFHFSTASSRYSEQLLSMPHLSDEEREKRVYAQFEESMREEEAVTPEIALVEVLPAVELCLEVVRESVLPFFEHTNRVAT